MSSEKICNTNTMGARLKEVRLDNDLSQSSFGGKIGLSQGYIANVERGKYHLSSEYFSRIACEFDVNLDWLINGEGKKYRYEGIEYPKKEKVYELESQVYASDKPFQVVQEIGPEKEKTRGPISTALLAFFEALPIEEQMAELQRMQGKFIASQSKEKP